MRESFRKEEQCRFQGREVWWSKLLPEDMKAFDLHCLAMAEPSLQPILQTTISVCLRGSLARLVFEYAAIARRYTAARSQTEHRGVVNRARNRTVINSLLGGLTHDEREAKSRLVGRWFRELTSEQRTEFDRSALGLTPAESSSALDEATTDANERKKPRRKPGPKRPRHDPKNDKRMYDEWKAAQRAGQRRFVDFERDKGYDRGTVRYAVKRHQERMRSLQ